MKIKENNSFAYFRIPNSSTVQYIEGNCSKTLLNLGSTKTNSFLISPFNKGNLVIEIPFDEIQLEPNYSKQSHQIINNSYNNLGKDYYLNLVQTAIKKLKNNDLKKVVLANTKNCLKNSFDPKKLFEKLVEAYPSAFVYYISTPLTGTWIGASPEPLITYANYLHKTVALAGTRLKNANGNWSEKEIIEQKWVSEYIYSILKKHQLEFKENGPFNYETGELIHLKTEFEIENWEKLVSTDALISDLNPTPATAGFPKEDSIQFIIENEGFERNLYTGYIGLKQNNQLNLFVNLRCLNVGQQNLTLFAGAGITEDSIPEKEWIETQNKMMALEKYL
ncbi:MAG: chorismate-binding protein [Bacteroidia bacterium]|nr:chorismate-binding protein [Bacteroidia bacterium]MCF8428222.1 chorismate-binding protein [Bacteroidia bacterium]MCF8447607.1 chorismate-binding protein [Bacteroidia bacterium]